MLKEYQVAVITALKNSSPDIGESYQAYMIRQQRLREKVTEAWERFEIER
jgi:hypothetical protein